MLTASNQLFCLGTLGTCRLDAAQPKGLVKYSIFLRDIFKIEKSHSQTNRGIFIHYTNCQCHNDISSDDRSPQNKK